MKPLLGVEKRAVQNLLDTIKALEKKRSEPSFPADRYALTALTAARHNVFYPYAAISRRGMSAINTCYRLMKLIVERKLVFKYDYHGARRWTPTDNNLDGV